MAYPGKNHKAYETPKRRFEKSRIEDENRLVIEFGLRNKTEVWKAQSTLRGYRRAARDLLALRSASTDAELIARKENELLGHLESYGLLGENADIGAILSLKAENELERRLQTLVYRRGLARSPKQARQMITHGHITVEGRRVTVPGYRVRKVEESSITYDATSVFKNDAHPERVRINSRGRA
ncbi:MAG: 30S ribosomal protein S4 [Methanomicrobium sp.]|nr:30S ribosomal protein S4 [Methanomicrobium sp.]MBO4522740.1 30S ribosomal protein S4 [Methanomicrobium sp.]MBR6011334.1 30S ribosomal protein S4 [Methanomicrobium sp.]MBR6448059.1 30S ribosomal protein S4 [Methanomicrobium sp.]MBR6497519.1 30S ribosomal protein S4 [Methanomicrobium sp.]